MGWQGIKWLYPNGLPRDGPLEAQLHQEVHSISLKEIRYAALPSLANAHDPGRGFSDDPGCSEFEHAQLSLLARTVAHRARPSVGDLPGRDSVDLP